MALGVFARTVAKKRGSGLVNSVIFIKIFIFCLLATIKKRSVKTASPPTQFPQNSMTKFSYKVLYQYSGPTKDSPFRKKKTNDEISEAFMSFKNDLGHFIDDQELHILQVNEEIMPPSITVVLTTNLSEQQVDEGVKKCMNSYDLFGEKLNLR